MSLNLAYYPLHQAQWKGLYPVFRKVNYVIDMHNQKMRRDILYKIALKVEHTIPILLLSNGGL